MLGNVTCWAIAIGLMFSRSHGFTDDYKKILLAMGFILLANLCKFVDVYHDVNNCYECKCDKNGAASDSTRK